MSRSKPRGKTIDEQMPYWSAYEKHLERKYKRHDREKQKSETGDY